MSCLFFFKQKTAYEMRISDWSSDVCSSDLVGDQAGHGGRQRRQAFARVVVIGEVVDPAGEEIAALRGLGVAQARLQLVQAAAGFVAVRDQAGVGDPSLCAVPDADADPDAEKGGAQQAGTGSYLSSLPVVAGEAAGT